MEEKAYPRTGSHHIVIYKNPLDFPGDFVVKVWDIRGKEPFQLLEYTRLEKTIEAARSHVRPGFVNVGRFVEDDPVIYEVWI